MNAVLFCELLILGVMPGEAIGGSADGQVSVDRNASQIPRAYCGIYCLYRAFGAFDREVSIGDLVCPKYVDSKKGSSASALASAARDFQLHCAIIGRMDCRMLKHLSHPTILHVKSSYGSDYDHWVLFMGVQDGRARIYDGPGGVELADFRKLAAIWDGLGLVISDDQAIRRSLQLEALVPFAIFSAVSLGFLGGAKYFQEKLGSVLHFQGTTAALVMQSLCVLSLTALAWLAYSLANPQGYLAFEPAIHGLQLAKLHTFLTKVSPNGADELLRSGGAIFVDARTQPDFANGHLPGAINIPSSTSANDCRSKLPKVLPNQPIVLYCESSGCPYAKTLARTLWSAGYSNLMIFEGGWREWMVYGGAHETVIDDERSQS